VLGCVGFEGDGGIVIVIIGRGVRKTLLASFVSMVVACIIGYGLEGGIGGGCWAICSLICIEWCFEIDFFRGSIVSALVVFRVVIVSVRSNRKSSFVSFASVVMDFINGYIWGRVLAVAIGLQRALYCALSSIFGVDCFFRGEKHCVVIVCHQVG